MMKNKIGIINVTTSNTKGIVMIADNKNKKPDRILMFIEIKAKNEINKQTMKYTIIAQTPFCNHITNCVVLKLLFANTC